MPRTWTNQLCCLLLGLYGAAARADEFDRIEGQALAAIPSSKDAIAHRELSIVAIEALPSVLRETRSALLIVKTDEGNIARMLVAPAFRKSHGDQGKPIPVLVVERFDTFEGGNLATRLARGRELLLFDDFRLDLDSGQIVPEGQGGDLRFQAGTTAPPTLRSLAKTTIYTLSKAPSNGTAGTPKPTIGRSVVPGDFAGRYRLFANGQWSGTLDLSIEPGGEVSGRFRSDLRGTSYTVDGRVSREFPQKIAFAIRYPRTRQDFEGLLWTEGKGAMAGTLTMLDRTYGFFAIREGGHVTFEGDDVGPLPKESDRKSLRTVTCAKGQFTLDGKSKTDRELTDALRRAVAEDAGTRVLLRTAENETYATIEAAFNAISAAGVSTIRLGPADPEP